MIKHPGMKKWILRFWPYNQKWQNGRLLKNLSKFNWELITSITALLLSLFTLFVTHIKPFEAFIYSNEPIWYNFSHRTDKITFRDLGIILTLVIYNKGSQPGLIEDIVVNLENDLEMYSYQPYIFVDDPLTDIKIQIKSPNDKLLTRQLLSRDGFVGYFSPILLKPYEQKVINILFTPNIDIDKAPLSGNFLMHIKYSMQDSDKYKTYTKKLSPLDIDAWGHSLHLEQSTHADRKKLLVSLEKKWKLNHGIKP